MKTNNKSKIFGKLFLLIGLIATQFACSEYFENPLKDKESGEDINLLIVDFNFFTTRMTYKILDASDGSILTEDVKLTFTGKNYDDIVNYSGEKNAEYHTTVGQIELTVDPNVAVSESSPLEFAVTAEAKGYNTLSRGIRINGEGIKTFELLLSKIENQDETDLNGNIDTSGNDTTFNFSVPNTYVKSAQAEKQFVINYSITMSNLLKFLDKNGNPLFLNSDEVMNAYNSDPANFSKMTVSTFSTYQPGVETVNIGNATKSVIMQKLETGSLKKLVLGGKEVGSLGSEQVRGPGEISSSCTFLGDPAPEMFGFFKFDKQNWNYLSTQTVYKELFFDYTVGALLAGSEANVDLCGKGASITFTSSATSSFSITADVYDESNSFIGAITFTGNFPETFFIENVPSVAGKLVFRNNNPSFEELPELVVNNLCDGSFTVNIEPTEGYAEYQIALKVLCPADMTVAIAPTYSAEIRLKNSTNPWQGVNMKGGIIDILGLPNSEYELRLLWKNEWEYSTYATQFDANGKYIGPKDPDATITSELLDDGRTLIRVTKMFEQNICNDMGW